MKRTFSQLLCCAMALCMLSCTSSTNRFEGPVKLFDAGQDGYHTYRIPAIITAGDGSLIAFAEGRVNNHKDFGDIDLVAKRSTDRGRTWSDLMVIQDDSTNCCDSPIPVLLDNGRLLLLSMWRGQRNGIRLYNQRSYIQYSDDNGLTWSEKREITDQVRDTTWLMHCLGPGHAIVLKQGSHNGRIIVPSYHKWTFPGEPWYGKSYIVYSDDSGQTWQMGAFATAGNECMAAELSNGDIYLNMREFTIWNKQEGRTYQRLTATSSDGGETLSEAVYDPNLPAAVCEGSVLRYYHRHKKADWLLFMNPEGPKERVNLKVKLSKDGGKSWKQIYDAPFAKEAYSDMAELPDGSVAILYEAGDSTSRDCLAFDIIPASQIR